MGDKFSGWQADSILLETDNNHYEKLYEQYKSVEHHKKINLPKLSIKKSDTNTKGTKDMNKENVSAQNKGLNHIIFKDAFLSNKCSQKNLKVYDTNMKKMSTMKKGKTVKLSQMIFELGKMSKISKRDRYIQIFGEKKIVKTRRN